MQAFSVTATDHHTWKAEDEIMFSCSFAKKLWGFTQQQEQKSVNFSETKTSSKKGVTKYVFCKKVPTQMISLIALQHNDQHYDLYW